MKLLSYANTDSYAIQCNIKRPLLKSLLFIQIKRIHIASIHPYIMLMLNCTYEYHNQRILTMTSFHVPITNDFFLRIIMILLYWIFFAVIQFRDFLLPTKYPNKRPRKKVGYSACNL